MRVGRSDMQKHGIEDEEHQPREALLENSVRILIKLTTGSEAEAEIERRRPVAIEIIFMFAGVVVKKRPTRNNVRGMRLKQIIMRAMSMCCVLSNRHTYTKAGRSRVLLQYAGSLDRILDGRKKAAVAKNNQYREPALHRAEHKTLRLPDLCDDG